MALKIEEGDQEALHTQLADEAICIGLAKATDSYLNVQAVLSAAIVFWNIRQNPYPLVFFVLKESAIPAFFTRSSAANIPNAKFRELHYQILL